MLAIIMAIENDDERHLVERIYEDYKPAALDDIAGRLANIPNLEQYKDVIQRFLSGESELEVMGKGHKPLTEDQIALRKLMREYMSTDTRTPSQMQMDMQKANNNFLNYWQANGNGAPPPGRVIASDGSFKIFNSKAEKDEYRKNTTLDFLKTVMSVINAGNVSKVENNSSNNAQADNAVNDGAKELTPVSSYYQSMG